MKPMDFERFTAARSVQVVEGSDLSLTIERALPDPVMRSYAVAEVDGVEVPRGKWAGLALKAGQSVRVALRPRGGKTGKKILRTVLTIAVVVVATWMTGGLGTAGLTGLLGKTGAAIAAGAFTAVAGLAINALVPPPGLGGGPRQEIDPTYSLTGARNNARPNAAVPVVFGSHRFVPDLITEQYQESVGDDIWLRFGVCWGAGYYEVDNLRIGDTPIGNFDGVSVQHQLTPDAPPTTMMRGDFTQLAVGATLDTGWTEYRTADNALDAEIMLQFPRGLGTRDDEGNPQAVSVPIEVRVRAVADNGDVGEWTDLGAASPDVADSIAADLSYTSRTAMLDAPGVSRWADYVSELEDAGAVSLSRTYRRSDTKPFSSTIAISLPSGQRFDIAVRRASAEDSDIAVANECVWSTLTTFQDNPIVGDARLATSFFRIKASEQLSGFIDSLNGDLHRLVPTYTGPEDYGLATAAHWNGARVRSLNCADCLLEAAQGIQTSAPTDDDEIHWPDLAQFWLWCRDNDFTFSLPMDGARSRGEVMDTIAAAGRARLYHHNGRLRIAIDRPRVDGADQIITPRNARQFSFTRTFAPTVHAFRLPFVNRDNDFIDDELYVYAPGYHKQNATLIEDLPCPGQLSPAKVFEYGHYMMAQALDRTLAASCEMDIEAGTLKLGDYVRLSHPVIDETALWPRVESAAGLTIDLDMVFEPDPEQSYVIRHRRIVEFGGEAALHCDGLYPIVTPEGPTRSITLAEALPEGVEFEPDDLCVIGIAGQDTFEGLIAEIEPAGPAAARVEMVAYLPDSLIAPDPPEHVPSGRVPFRSVPSPDLVGVTRTESEVAVAFTVPESILGRLKGFDVRYRPASGEAAWLQAPALGADARTVAIAIDAPDAGLSIEICAIDVDGRRSPPLVVLATGALEPLPAPANPAAVPGTVTGVGGTKVPVLDVTVDPVDTARLSQLVVETRIAGSDDDWIVSATASSAQRVCRVFGLPPGQTLDVRLAWQSPRGGLTPVAVRPVVEDVLIPSTLVASNTLAVAGQTAAQVLGNISSAQDGVAALTATYGSTASAAASAAAALSSAGDAETAQSAAETAQAASEAARGLAETAQGLAETAKAGAITARGGAETALATTETARDVTIAAKDQALAADVSATNAAGVSVAARDAASGHASAASDHEDAAGVSASAAGASAASASGSANTAATEAGNASASAAQSASSASDALGSKNAAASSASLSAVLSSPKGVTKNGDFRFGGQGWLLNGAQALASYDGEAGVVRADGYKLIAGDNSSDDYLTPVDPNRKYRLHAKVRATVDGMTFYTGINEFDADGVYISTNRYPGMFNQTVDASEGWVSHSGGILSGIGSGSLDFHADTAFVTVRALLGYTTGTQATGYISELWLEDVTAQDDAEVAAAASAVSASLAEAAETAAGASATSASASANTATTKAGEALSSASQSATSASDALGSKNDAASSAALSVSAKDAALGAKDDAEDAAAASAVSASGASASQTGAESAASSATASANTATTKAGEAAASASQSASSASSAEGLKNQAASSATLSASTLAASTVLTQDPLILNPAVSFSAYSGFLVENVVDAPGGTVLRKSGHFDLTGDISTPIEVNRYYRLTATVRRLGSKDAGTARAYIGIRAYDEGGAYAGSNNGRRYAVPNADLSDDDEWYALEGVFSPADLGQASGYNLPTSMRPYVLLNYPDYEASVTHELGSFKIEDVTAEVLSAASAAASATSASVASAAETAAGASATSATASANTATTKAGEATAAAVTAVSAKDDAEGSATTATAQAGLATSAKDAAAGSAAAAATSANQSASSAGTAGAAASSATASANTATTQAGSSSASAASSASSASSAEGFKNQAASSATLAVSAKDAALGAKDDAEDAAAASAVSASGASASQTGAESAASSATASANTATTKAGEASASAGQAASSEGTASGHAVAAASSAALSVVASNPKGLTKNGHFLHGNAGWFLNGATALASYDGEVGVIRADDSYKFIAGNNSSDDYLIPVDPNRKYRLHTKVRATVDGMTFYSGIREYDADGVHLGTNKYPGMANQTVDASEGWVSHTGGILSGIGSGSLDFHADTAFVVLRALLGYTTGTQADSYISELWLEDVTAQDDAEVAASAAATSASSAAASETAAGGFATSATNAANTAGAGAATATASKDTAVAAAASADGSAIAAAASAALSINASAGTNLLSGTRFLGPDYPLTPTSVHNPNSITVQSGEVWTGSDTWILTGDEVWAVEHYGGAADGTGRVDNATDNIPVEAGKRYAFSIYTGAHNCTVNSYIAWYNAAGGYIGDNYGGGNILTARNVSEKAGGKTLAGYKRIVTFGDAPAGAVTARAAVRKFDHATGTESFGFYARPAFQEIQPSATTAGAWSDGMASSQFGEVAAVTADLEDHAAATYGFELAAEAGGQRALAGLRAYVAAGVGTLISNFAITANKIILASGAAVFQLLSDRVLSNVPIGIELGDNALYLFPNSSMLLWYGDKTTALASMSNANCILALDSSGNNTITYRGADLETGAPAFYTGDPDTGSGTGALTVDIDGFKTRGNAMRASLVFKGVGEGEKAYLNQPTPPSVGGIAAFGDVDLTLEYSTNAGSSWTAAATDTNVNMNKVSSLSLDGGADDYIEVITVNAILELTASVSVSAGSDVLWRAKATNISVTSGVLFTTHLSASVIDT